MPDFAQPPRVVWACVHVRGGEPRQLRVALSIERSMRARAGDAWPDDVDACAACAARLLRVVLKIVDVIKVPK